MNRIFFIASTLILLFAAFPSAGQSASKSDPYRTETFRIYGNCEMCRETIESALKKKDGVIKKDWSPRTKQMKVTYDTTRITLREIKQKIADKGYDTDEIRGSDEAYSKLHKCCKYKRVNS
jgi:periplasmic mercuric ion binding protein